MTATYPLARPSAFAANATNPLANLDTDLVNLTDTLNGLGNGVSVLSSVTITTASITSANISLMQGNVSITGGSASLTQANLSTVYSGNITAAFFTGDGSQLTNIAGQVPTGGTTGQSLIKNSNTNNDIKWAQPPLLGLQAPTTTAGGTAFGYTGIASNARRITMTLNGVGANLTTTTIIQIGSGSYKTSGYMGSVTDSSTATVSNTAFGGSGMVIQASQAAASRYVGQAILTLLDASNFIWSFFSVSARTDIAANAMSAGIVTLSGALDRVQLTTDTGTPNFVAGSINILVE